MSEYLSKNDSSDEENVDICELNDEEVASVKNTCAALKAEGNAFFASQNYEDALAKYTVI